MKPTRMGIVIFAAVAAAGPWYTVDGYSLVSHVISLLGAQNTTGNSVMVTGFLALGLGIILDGVRRFSWPALPFMVFGLCMALAGLFAHKPLSPEVDFSKLAHQIHSALATLAGISITVGLLWQAARKTALRPRLIALALAALCLGLPLCMLSFLEFQGLIQRLMYLLIFAWLWACYPPASPANKEPNATGGLAPWLNR